MSIADIMTTDRKLLIAPEGIEITAPAGAYTAPVFLLIAPEGIEMIFIGKTDFAGSFF